MFRDNRDDIEWQIHVFRATVFDHGTEKLNIMPCSSSNQSIAQPAVFKIFRYRHRDPNLFRCRGGWGKFRQRQQSRQTNMRILVPQYAALLDRSRRLLSFRHHEQGIAANTG